MRVFTLFLFVFFVSPINAETTKIGYIDTEMVVNNLTLYKDGKNLIASEFEQKKQELLDLFNHIELIRSSKNELDDNEIKQILELESSFKKETEFWQTTINQKQVDLLRDIEIIINDAIKELAIEDNFDLIFYENAAFVSNNVDISNKIISKIESQTP